ncbi:hypothetical protein KHP60_15660 [Microvirga sp. 3-52]|uniref:hypothetical protein n=1 Tax=Microvirga sp. 3-52 TaxID=2792425 RepID=UPI001AC93B3B|nr:hypothetical protein [Microvirga sp. 3-52]MBO1906640.1 hypothetical protein [Microvirga sp. 3-52]MBS7453767.1 hypothetical protein [Microvirga sp. 3-52]
MTAAHQAKTADAQSVSGQIELDDDRFFDPWRMSRTPNAQALVADVIRQVESYERHGKMRARKRRPVDQAIFEETIAAIICDLTHAYLSGHEDGIAITRSNRDLAKKSRYHPKALGMTLPRVLDHLASREMEFIGQQLGFKHEFADRHQRTLIWPGARLTTRIKERKLDLSDFGRSSSEEVIILKADKEDFWDKGEWIEYDETDATALLRSRLRQINEWLKQADIHHDDERNGTYGDLDHGERRLRRVFTQSSFESGGRLFGGLWQRMKKEQRLESLWIREERVIELDFGQMAPRMLYGMVGVTPPMADAYLVPGFGDPQGFRDGFKKLFSSLLFAEKPLERKPQGTKELLPNEPVQVLVQRLQDHHPQIAHFFGSGRGHELQFRESEMMVEILLRLQAKDIVALPVHDAVIIPSYAEEVTRKVMSEVFLEKVGIEALITTTS